VFAEQADSLWSRLAEECRQFAEGFNEALGSRGLEVHADRETLQVAYPQAEIELLMELDKSERYIQASFNSGPPSARSRFTDPLSVGLTVSGNQLRFVLGGDVVSEEHVAVTLLTQLTSGNTQPL
jgi:hypothetical protein